MSDGVICWLVANKGEALGEAQLNQLFGAFEQTDHSLIDLYLLNCSVTLKKLNKRRIGSIFIFVKINI